MSGLKDKDHPDVRLAGVTGLIGIDKAMALKICKEQNLMADPSPAIREVLLDLAGQVGTKEDLDWIAKQFLKNGTADSAWQAFRAICQRQNAETLVSWAKQLDEKKVQADRIRQLWEISEQKAQAETNSALLKEIWPALFSIYADSHDSVQTLELAKRVRGAGDKGVLSAVHPQILKAALSSQQWGQAELVFREALEQGDQDGSSPLVMLVESYLKSPENTMDSKKGLVAALIRTKSNPDRPEWNQKLEVWNQQVFSVPPGSAEQAKAAPNAPEEQDKEVPVSPQ